jgi:arsenate reductase-like glutaredoxin family protein
MGKAESQAIVYTLPDCSRCEELKEWLSEEGIEFESKNFTTEVQLEYIMNNMFGNPPILEFGKASASSEDLFPDELLNKAKVMEVLSHS